MYIQKCLVTRYTKCICIRWYQRKWSLTCAFCQANLHVCFINIPMCLLQLSIHSGLHTTLPVAQCILAVSTIAGVCTVLSMLISHLSCHFNASKKFYSIFMNFGINFLFSLTVPHAPILFLYKYLNHNMGRVAAC